MDEKQKVVIDTNIILSAFGWKGKPLEILNLLEKNKIQNFISPPMLEEIKKAISYDKFNFSYELQAKIIEFISFYSTLVLPKVNLDVIKDDPGDNKFIECAVASKAKYIISGDEHLLSLKKVKGIKILSADTFLKEFVVKPTKKQVKLRQQRRLRY